MINNALVAWVHVTSSHPPLQELQDSVSHKEGVLARVEEKCQQFTASITSLEALWVGGGGVVNSVVVVSVIGFVVVVVVVVVVDVAEKLKTVDYNCFKD